ncbi:MAG: 5-oxoprolinase subunit C family protein [Bacillota bacterium]
MSRAVVEVIAPGLSTTVQDLGRPGFARYGLAPGGAADDFAIRAANLLVDNPPEAAALEVTLRGPTLRFGSAAAIAITGADLGASLDGRPLEGWRGHRVSAGQTLAFGRPVQGCRAYLTVHGGLDVPVSMGSRSTDLRAGLGWGGGRALVAGDRLPVSGRGVPAGRLEALALGLERLLPAGDRWPGDYLEREAVAASPGPQEDHFAPSVVDRFFSARFTVGAASDRMGLRLVGPVVAPMKPDIVSDGLVAGAVQVPESGQPLCLLAGHQTTGGYPKIAVAGVAHQRVLGQRPPLSGLAFFRTAQADLDAEAVAYLVALRAWEAFRLGERPPRVFAFPGGPLCRVE